MSLSKELKHFFPLAMHTIQRKFEEKYWNTRIPPCLEYPNGIFIDLFGLPVMDAYVEDKKPVQKETQEHTLKASHHYNTRRDFTELPKGEKRYLINEQEDLDHDEEDEDEKEYEDEGDDEGDNEEEDEGDEKFDQEEEEEMGIESNLHENEGDDDDDENSTNEGDDDLDYGENDENADEDIAASSF